MPTLADVAQAAGSWATVGLFIVAVLGLGLAFHRWLKHNVAEPIKQVAVIADNQELIGRIVARMDSRLLVVESQVTNNGGASMKDSTDRNEAMTKAASDGVRELLKRGDA